MMLHVLELLLLLVAGQSSIEDFLVRVPGDSVRLTCESRCDVTSVTWFHRDDELSVADGSKYLLASDHSLVVFNVSDVSVDAGVYRCEASGVTLTEYRVNFDPGSLLLRYFCCVLIASCDVFCRL